MFLASADFAAIHAATQGIPLVLALVWGTFALIPGAVLGAGFLSRMYRRLFPVPEPALPTWEVRYSRAERARLYACIPGQYGIVWARKGETADQLLARVSSL